MNIMDLVNAIVPECDVNVIGIRPGEKLHEVLISEDEARHTVELTDVYVVQPAHPWWFADNWAAGRPLPDALRFCSENNMEWRSIEDLRTLVGGLA